ncbi:MULTISPECIES: cytochrome c oxidase assembly protein [unclassified Sinorhizobium]|uniref:cytochrome c oxidase assembly protein n=1 Tax=unclassified Sinorhizobium TaxID=2613772 RepID=UPI0035249205
MRTLSVIMLLLMSVDQAAAHEARLHIGVSPWTFDPWIVVPIAIAGALFAIGSMRLLPRLNNHRFLVHSGIAYWTGWLVLVAALISPLHFLGEHLFTFHMIEHELVMAVSAPLLVVARPIAVLLWGLPRSMRQLVHRTMKTAFVARTWATVSAASTATILHGVAIWAWHAPVLFDATVTDILLHRLQHLSFFLTAVVFWWAMIWRSDRGVAAWHLFLTMLHTSLLGALIALSPEVAYVSQTHAAPDWHLTPLEDQQLAGLVMWVPGGIIYAGAALLMLTLWIAHSSRGGLHASRYPAP